MLALGVLRNATGDAEFACGVREIARVLRPGGTVLVAHFSPASRPPDRALARVAGSAHAYRGFFGEDPDLPMVLHGAGELDAAFAAAGLAPVVASDTVVAPTSGAGSHRDSRNRSAGGTRVTVNGHYGKPTAP